MSGDKERTDVVIIGAGLAGLATGSLIDRELLILEARDRIGGRLLNQPAVDGLSVEGGGQFVGDGQPRLSALIDDLSLETFSAHTDGTFRWVQDIFGFCLGLSPNVAEPSGFEALSGELEALARTVDLEAPWSQPDLDNESLGAWLRREAPRKLRAPFERLCSMHIGCDPNQMSLLYMLFYLHAVGGYESAVRGAHAWRVIGGPPAICDALAERIGRDRIRCGQRVTRIVTKSDGATVVTESGDIECRDVVVTLQPQLCDSIAFEPALPEQRVRLQAEWQPRRARSAKVHFVYETPFWRDKGYSGMGATSRGVVTLDNSPPDLSHGVLLVFRNTDDSAQTRARLERYLVSMYGKAAAHPLCVVEQDWSAETLTAGCIGFTGPGTLAACGPALRAPIGPIHWAGAETGTTWPGLMEGALQSAERVADELDGG